MPKQKWTLRQKKVDFNAYAEALGVSPLIVRLLCNKGLMTVDEMRYYLYGTIGELHSPYLLLDAEKAMRILLDRILQKKQIRIIGDYDVDGVTATYILKRGITALGGEVSFEIPERIRDGYGLNKRLITDAATAGVDTIITCDNGIAAAEEIALAKESGMTVLVTDHHEVPFAEENGVRRELLPPADAIVDPKRAEDTYPYKEICGAFVAYKCIQILFDLASGQALISAEDASKILSELTEFAALGTVCDVMPLLDENRILVKEGLRSMADSGNLGVRTLIETCELAGAQISSYHVGYVIGPCLNATGRLDTAEKALALFETEEKRDAVDLATELRRLNEERKKMTDDGVREAFRRCDEELKEDKVLVVYLPDCHESIAGIIAGKVREKYAKPCLVVTKSKEGLKGSGRSIETYHMRDGLQGVSDLLDKFGGHKLAAGFSMSEENLEPFRRRLNEQAALTEEDFVQEVVLDIDLPIDYATMEFAEELKLLQPFGKDNERPLFGRKDIRVEQIRLMGKSGRAARCTLRSPGGVAAPGVYFGEAEKFAADMREAEGELLLAYYPDINEYKGTRSLQLVISHYEVTPSGDCK